MWLELSLIHLVPHCLFMYVLCNKEFLTHTCHTQEKERDYKAILLTLKNLLSATLVKVMVISVPKLVIVHVIGMHASRSSKQSTNWEKRGGRGRGGGGGYFILQSTVEPLTKGLIEKLSSLQLKCTHSMIGLLCPLINRFYTWCSFNLTAITSSSSCLFSIFCGSSTWPSISSLHSRLMIPGEDLPIRVGVVNITWPLHHHDVIWYIMTITSSWCHMVRNEAGQLSITSSRYLGKLCWHVIS